MPLSIALIVLALSLGLAYSARRRGYALWGDRDETWGRYIVMAFIWPVLSALQVVHNESLADLVMGTASMLTVGMIAQHIVLLIPPKR